MARLSSLFRAAETKAAREEDLLHALGVVQWMFVEARKREREARKLDTSYVLEAARTADERSRLVNEAAALAESARGILERQANVMLPDAVRRSEPTNGRQYNVEDYLREREALIREREAAGAEADKVSRDILSRGPAGTRPPLPSRAVRDAFQEYVDGLAHAAGVPAVRHTTGPRFEKLLTALSRHAVDEVDRGSASVVAHAAHVGRGRPALRPRPRERAPGNEATPSAAAAPRQGREGRFLGFRRER
jgi:hypothetical protein